MKKENYISVNQQENIKTLLLNDNYKYWLGGFVEGEGTLLASVVKSDELTNKYTIKPEFNVAQHETGLNILYSFKILFNNIGSVHKKSGSDKVWVFSIKGIENILNHVIPFFESYVLMYSNKYDRKSFDDYCFTANELYKNKNKTMDKKDLINLITLAYSLNPTGKGKQRKRSLEEIVEELELI